MPPKPKSSPNADATEEREEEEKLEEYLHTGLNDLKNQISADSNINSNDGASTFLTKLSAFENIVQDSIKDIKSEINRLQKQMEIIGKETDNLNQERMRNILVFYGLREKETEDLCEEVCKIIKSKLKITLTVNDINYCFRLAKKLNNGDGNKKPRPTAVVFFLFKEKFASTPWVISEGQYKVLQYT